MNNIKYYSELDFMTSKFALANLDDQVCNFLQEGKNKTENGGMFMKEINDITRGNLCFLVKDKDISRWNDSEFIIWLENQGFEQFKGWWDGVDWVYININSKTYMCGMIGVDVMGPIGNHALTTDEFMTIYNIYKKYDGKSVFSF